MFTFKKRRVLEMPYNQQLFVAQNFLNGVLGRDIRAVVGGGFLRDIYFERSWKDLDVFINHEDIDDWALLDKLTKHGFTARVVVSNEAIEYLSFTDVASVIEATHPHYGFPVQIIRMGHNNQSPERMIERLDLGPCQIGMDIVGNIWHTDQFINDAIAHTFTVTRDEKNDRERSVKRFKRLSAKYPGWKMVG